MAKLFTFCFVLLLSNIALSQEEDEACMPPDKKTMKAIDRGLSPKSDFRTASMAFSEAISLSEDNVMPHFIYAEYLFDRALDKYEDYKIGRANFAQVKTQFLALEDRYKTAELLCPNYHASIYYKIGYINFYIKRDVAQGKAYFQKFLDFKNDNPDAFPDEYSTWKAEVNRLLQEISKKEEENAEASEFFETKVPYDPVRVQNVSTEMDEYLPMISPDNELIFYTRRGDFRNLGEVQSNVREMFSVSQRPNVQSAFNKGEGLRPPFNTPEFNNYGGVSLSLDNKEMFICACKDEMVQGQSYNNCDIYVTYFKRTGQGGYDYVWTPLQNLGSNINTNSGWEAQPTLSADGNTLYFATYRKNSQLTDIYYSERQKDGSWSLAKPVPGPINTDGHDKAPFLHQDSETMYFVSQATKTRTGAGTDGNFDVYYSRKDENGNWMEPTNLGYPINTEKNEVGLVVSTDGKLAYIATDRGENAQGVDLYYFELYEAARPQKILFLKGELKDDFGDPVADANLEVTYKESGESVSLKINGDDGKFAAVVNTDKAQDVLIAVKKKGFSFDTQVIEAEEVAAAQKGATFKANKLDLEIGELEIGKAFTIDNILFATNSYALTSDAKFVLSQLIAFLKENPTVTAELQGHTDDQGNDAENLKLSENRAKATMNYIVSQGISKNRLTAVGFGETEPKFENNTEANRAKNRRTDFKLTGM
ncbi:MAG: OmpA family protein [Putridiphycobacter sp.]|nr:OmpA family protein [Putridiphycobacter sp.]